MRMRMMIMIIIMGMKMRIRMRMMISICNCMGPRASKSAREQTNYSASIFLGLRTEHILKPINLTTYYHKIIRFIRSFVQSVAPRIRTEII